MNLRARATPDWDAIDTVLLDLDGTLLDLAFDTHIWMGRVPQLYGAARGWSQAAALAALAPKFHALQGTLNWYCIQYWSRELQIDIAELHRTESERVAWLPGAREFLDDIRSRGKRLVLLTNGHPLVVDVKQQRTGVLDWFHAAYTSHQFGHPKEHPEFWQRVREVEPFDPQRSMFVDDSDSVLAAAQRAGIAWIYQVQHPDSSRAPRAASSHISGIAGVRDFL